MHFIFIFKIYAYRYSSDRFHLFLSISAQINNFKIGPSLIWVKNAMLAAASDSHLYARFRPYIWLFRLSATFVVFLKIIDQYVVEKHSFTENSFELTCYSE